MLEGLFLRMPPPMGTLPPPPALPPLTPEELEAKEEVGEVADTAADESGFGTSGKREGGTRL